MTRRCSPHRLVGYSLAVLAVAVGLWLLRDRTAGVDLLDDLASFDPFGRGRPVILTGVGRRGQVEVPVINLWERPGFGRDNHVAARLRMDAGMLAAALVTQRELDGVTWNEVRVSETRGWVVSRFVREQ